MKSCCSFTSQSYRSAKIFLISYHLLLLFLGFLSLVVSSPSSSISGLYKDSQLLLSFKASLPDTKQLQNWIPSINPCNFTGVACESSRISFIELRDVKLSVDFHYVSTFLMTLPNLKSLVLKNANLGGVIKIETSSQCSTMLSLIDLAENGISGPISGISSFSVCSSLKSLNLSNNLFDYNTKGSKGLLIAPQVLDLSFNKISGQNVVPWLLFSGCGELQYLSLKGNKVVGTVSMSHCKSLKYLDLSSNNFSIEFPSFGDCPSLEYLDLSSNKFFGDISTSISSCQNLTFLNLTSNHFSGAIPTLPSGVLQSVHLSKNGFQGVIPPQLLDLCSSLVELDISFNNLSGAVPEGFATCFSLELLDISNNNFSGELPIETLLKLGKLKSLLLSFNNFHGLLPESLSKLTNLVTLDVSSNNFLGSIPSGICQDPMSNLQVLYLQNNKFTGPIPDSLSNCSQLISLDLSFNYLTGTIPSSLGSLSKLMDLIIMFNQLHGEIPLDLAHMQALENLILDFNYFSGSIPASLSNCTNLNWISLSNNKLSGEIPASFGLLSNLAILKLGNNSLYGSIPSELGDCDSLIWLDLNTNKLSGSIPPALFKQSGNIAVSWLTGKNYVYIKNDGSSQDCHGAGNLLEFGGIRLDELERVSSRSPCNFTRVYRGMIQPTFNHNGSMLFLDLSHNDLEGGIPKEIGSMFYLFILNLGHNNLSGPIPQELEGLRGIGILDLSYNRLNGSIPQALTSLTLLNEIDLSNNLLSGMIPQSAQFNTFPYFRFLNNSGLCGYPLNHCGEGLDSNSKPHEKSHGRQASLIGSMAVGLLFSLFCIFALIVAAIEMKKRKKKMDAALDAYFDNHSHTATNINWKVNPRDLSINLATFEKPLRKLTFADLFEATNGFHNDFHVGSGGFGDVYKAELKDGNVVAIKKLIHVSGQADREFTAEMETIGKIKHRNLVPLLGYCKVGEERLLVYEYMKFGSLEDVLHDKRKIGIKLNWAARRKIAVGAARGLSFLHHNCIPHIIHRDMKSSNVLLDENFEARVSDFGMARLVSAMDTHLSVSTLAGTPGYVPPEYYQSFRCSTKGDVYSYGVVLLELLTRKQSTNAVDFGDNNLVGWVRQHIKTRISDVFDPEILKEDPSFEIELLQHLKIAFACLDDRPWKRPTMIEVMKSFKEIQTGISVDSASTIFTVDDGSFSTIEGVGMSIKEDSEPSKQ